MIFEWDEGKRRSNIEKHGLDFTDAALFFRGLRCGCLQRQWMLKNVGSCWDYWSLLSLQ